jgi:hypothetical protein
MLAGINKVYGIPYDKSLLAALGMARVLVCFRVRVLCLLSEKYSENERRLIHLQHCLFSPTFLSCAL